MILIAHRGLYNGPDTNLENKPEQILKSLELGYDCEIDLWSVDSKLFLGHNEPQYEISNKFIFNNVGLWIHAKNLEALQWLSETPYKYFWHENDSFALTSNHYIWTYPDKELTSQSIMLMPEWSNPELTNIENSTCYGICSDYVEIIKNKFNTKFQRDIVLDLIG